MTPADMTPIELTMIAIFGLVLVLRNWWELVHCQFDAMRQQPPQAEPARAVWARPVTKAHTFGRFALPKARSVSVAARHRRRAKLAHLGHRTHKAHHH